MIQVTSGSETRLPVESAGVRGDPSRRNTIARGMPDLEKTSEILKILVYPPPQDGQKGRKYFAELKPSATIGNIKMRNICGG
jgi:hypothetical protein